MSESCYSIITPRGKKKYIYMESSQVNDFSNSLKNLARQKKKQKKHFIGRVLNPCSFLWVPDHII